MTATVAKVILEALQADGYSVEIASESDPADGSIRYSATATRVGSRWSARADSEYRAVHSLAVA